MGTWGYCAPEYTRTGVFNEKSDVFSFGVFLFELLTGWDVSDLVKDAHDLVCPFNEYLKNYFEDNRFTEILDPIIVEDVLSIEKERQLHASAQLTFECIKDSPADRPSMMSLILRKFKLREQTQSTDKATFVIRNGESVLKELIRASNGKYNPYCTFSAKELEIATNNYDSEKVIMKRSFYTLYKGFCQERLISVMKFDASKPRMYDCCINNIVYASQMIHRCFFKLIGCCLETQIPILVFEYINCGSLADRIRIQHNPQPQHEPLLLTHRLKIAKDIANAIAYLHVGFPRPVIFRDFKLSNILFNEENVAKLFDFSFSISIPEGELLTGLRAFDLARLNEDDGYVALRDHVKKYFEEDRLNEIIDPLIMGDRSCSGKEQQLQAYAHLIFECVNESPVDRPTMVDVAKKLKQMSRSCA
ncbi:hypothetical protein CUMW_199710 [Citrus unshiu]|nr:hypothetical protein CUMW_199710 [Citrus unshiu]